MRTYLFCGEKWRQQNRPMIHKSPSDSDSPVVMFFMKFIEIVY